MGTVFLASLDGKKVILKIERQASDDLTSRNPLIRQLIFEQHVASEHPEYFLQLQFAGIRRDCHFKHKITHKLEGSREKALQRKQASKDCVVLAYSPIMEFTLQSKLPLLETRQKLDCLCQILQAINIMRQNGFYHRDLHGGNIMGRTHGKNGIDWKIIDYGLVWHNDFLPNNGKFEFLDDDNNTPEPDLFALILDLIYNPILDVMEKKDIFLPPFQDSINSITHDQSFRKKIKPYLVHMSKKYRNTYIFILTLLFDYALFLKAFGADKLGWSDKKIEKYSRSVEAINTPIRSALLLALKHIGDNSYALLIRKIKMLKSKRTTIVHTL